MTHKVFEEALKIISENTGSSTIVEIRKEDPDKYVLKIKRSNASVVSKLVQRGFSLYISEEGTSLDNFKL